MSEATPCVYCAEPLPEGAARCPACGESTKPAAADLGPPRPLGPKIIALFSLLFGGLGLMGPIFTVVMYTVFPVDPNVPDPIRALAEKNALFKGWVFLSQGIGFVVAACHLASGIGLLGWREWGRRLGVQVAVAQLVLLVVSTLIAGAVCAEAMLSSSGATGPGGAPAAMLQGFALGAILVGACFGAILPVATLLVLRRPPAREAFAQAEAERPAK